MTAMNSIIYRYFLFPFKILMKDSLIETLSLTVANVMVLQHSIY